MVVSGHRERTVHKLMVNCCTEIQNWAGVDDLWQTVQLVSFSEKQVQWLTLQLSLVPVVVAEWTECS